MLKLVECPASLLADNLINKIAELSDRYFTISQSHLMRLLSDKDVIHLYYDDDRLVGILSFKWSIVDNKVFLYIGTVVIEDAYQKKGLLSNSLFKCIVYTYQHYYFKDKYAVAFATSPQAYHYFTILQEYWPRPDQKTPQHIINITANYLKAHNVAKYYIKEDAYIICELENILLEKNPKEISDKDIMEYFQTLIPDTTKGQQILCIVPFNLKNFLMILYKFSVKKIKKFKLKFIGKRNLP